MTSILLQKGGLLLVFVVDILAVNHERGHIRRGGETFGDCW